MWLATFQRTISPFLEILHKWFPLVSPSWIRHAWSMLFQLILGFRANYWVSACSEWASTSDYDWAIYRIKRRFWNSDLIKMRFLSSGPLDKCQPWKMKTISTGTLVAVMETADLCFVQGGGLYPWAVSITFSCSQHSVHTLPASHAPL